MSNKRPNAGSRALKAWRRELKLSVSAAAARVGIPQSSYSEYETGVKPPGFVNAEKIQRATGIAGTLFRPSPKEKPADQPAA